MNKLLTKLSILLFVAPVIGFFYVITVNNLSGTFWDIAFFYVYVTIFSGGLPIFMTIAAIRSWKNQQRGFKSLRLLSIILMCLTIAFMIFAYLLPPEIGCSHTNGVCSEDMNKRLAIFIITLEIIYGFSLVTSIRNLKNV
jgi:uncharacterized membrane protein